MGLARKKTALEIFDALKEEGVELTIVDEDPSVTTVAFIGEASEENEAD